MNMTFINFTQKYLPFGVFALCISLFFSSCGGNNEPQTPEPNADSSLAKPNNISIEQISALIESEPENSQLYYERALAFYEYGDLSSALNDFDKTISLEPDFASAFHDRGICKLELDMPDKALLDFNEAIELDDQYHEAYFNRALAYDALGNPKAALADLDKAIRINPEFGDAYYNRAVYQLNTDRDKACADFKKAEELGIAEAGLTMREYCK